jgi:isocitrate/isopropylmalate dehydrogenase
VAERVACLSGDGIGPEVMAEALRVLAMLPLDVEVVELPFGGAALDAFGDPLPADTLAACLDADAARPRPPATPEARSLRMSPNMFSVTTTSSVSGASATSIAKLSTSA